VEIETGKDKEKFIPLEVPLRLPIAFSLFYAGTLIFVFMSICTFNCYTYL